MAQTVQLRDTLPASADVVFAKMLDAKFMEEWTVVQQGINPRATVVENTETRAVMKVDLEEPIPALGTIKAHMTFNWDPKTKVCTWARVGEGIGSKSKVSGKTEIVAKGADSCEFIETTNIEISVPLVGKKLESQVIEYMQKGYPSKMAFMKKRLQG